MNVKITENSKQNIHKRRYFVRVAWVALLFLIVGSVVLTTFVQHRNVSKASDTRDISQWPFTSDSIFNMPIGSNAKYVPANLEAEDNTTFDPTYLVTTTSSDPLRTIYQPGAWGQGRCTGTQQGDNEQIPFPDNLVVPDATNGSTPNYGAAVILPDGHSMIQIEPLARCEAGGPLYGYIGVGWSSRQSLRSNGEEGGAHFGSGMNAIGGMIRKGELTNNDPIRHTLQLELWEKKYDYYSSETKGHRWPALGADNSAAQSYGGHNSSLMPGSLLAIPSAVTSDSLGLKTEVAKKIFTALQHYGGYNVDATGWSDHQIGAQVGVDEEVKQATGMGIDDRGSLHDDINKVFQALQVVDNNAPDNVGGGGTPLVPMAPPLSDEKPTPEPTQGATPIPTSMPTSEPTAQPTAPSTPVATPITTPVATPVTPGGTLPFNNVGASQDGKPSMANYDGAGNSYSANALQSAGIRPGKKITYNGVPFTWSDTPIGTVDNFQTTAIRRTEDINFGGTIGHLTGKVSDNSISLSSSGKTKALGFLGSSTNGPSAVMVTVTYSDGKKETFHLGFSDWTLNAGKQGRSYGNRIVAKMPYRNSEGNPAGQEVVNTYLFYSEIALPAGKQIQSITLPGAADQGHLHIFAIGTK